MSKYDFTEMESELLHSYFFNRIDAGKIEYLTEFLENPLVRKRLDPNCLLCSMFTATRLKSLKVFNYIYKYMQEDGHEFTNKNRELLFNALCGFSSVKRIKSLDKRFDLSSYMMQNAFGINEEDTIQREKSNPFLSYGQYYASYQEHLKKAWNTHGFIEACRKGHDELVDYIFSCPESLTSPAMLLEAGFIEATREHHFETALKIYPKLESINKSQFIQGYIEYNQDQSVSDFLSKLILKEQMENDLPKNTNSAKKLKL